MRAIADGVLVTPTLLRVEPTPERTVVGSLSATNLVAEALELPGRGDGAPDAADNTPHAARRTPHSDG